MLLASRVRLCAMPPRAVPSLPARSTRFNLPAPRSAPHQRHAQRVAHMGATPCRAHRNAPIFSSSLPSAVASFVWTVMEKTLCDRLECCGDRQRLIARRTCRRHYRGTHLVHARGGALAGRHAAPQDGVDIAGAIDHELLQPLDKYGPLAQGILVDAQLRRMRSFRRIRRARRS